MQFTNGFQALERFELIRRHLGHSAVLTADELTELRVMTGDKPLSDNDDGLSAFLVRYQEYLDVAQLSQHDQMFPDGVLPEVSPSTGFVRHATCTGNTEIVVNLRGPGHVTMNRPGEAIDPTDGFRTALAVLAGYLAGWDRDAVMPEDVTDPRVSALPVLARLVGDEEADRLVAAYVPHWESWALEQKVAAMEAQLRPLREERWRLARRNHSVPPSKTVVVGGEPMAE